MIKWKFCYTVSACLLICRLALARLKYKITSIKSDISKMCSLWDIAHTLSWIDCALIMSKISEEFLLWKAPALHMLKQSQACRRSTLSGPSTRIFKLQITSKIQGNTWSCRNTSSHIIFAALQLTTHKPGCLVRKGCLCQEICTVLPKGMVMGLSDLIFAKNSLFLPGH